tara:strand:- start:553 stop:2616 length:2064 start_codon:yes stop_codon:yes gene_type:complete
MILLCTFFSVLIISILFADIIFFDKSFASGDTLNPYAASNILDQSKSLLNEWPQWQPWIFSGMPSLESFTYVNLLYTPSYILNEIGFSDISIQFLHLMFTSIGMYLLINKLISKRYISIIVSMLWIMNPFLITMIVFGHGSQMMTASFFPWILYSLILLNDNPTLKNMTMLALLLGFQFQRAHVQIVYYSCMILFTFFIYNYIKIKDRKFFLLFLSAIFFAFLISAHIYLPSLDYKDLSIRSGDIANLQYATNWSMHPKELITYFLPYYYGFGGSSYTGFMPFTDYPNYVGLPVILLALFSLKNLSNNRLYFLSVLIVSILLSFGKYFSIFYEFFYNYLPFFSSFRVPSMILIVSNFCLYILCAYGLKDLSFYIIENYKKISYQMIMIFFFLISFLDIQRIDFQIINPPKDSGQKSQMVSKEFFKSIFIEDETIIFLKDNLKSNRIYPAGSLFTDPKFKYHGIESVGGYHPAKFNHYAKLMSNTNNLLSIPVLQFLNVKYFISTTQINHPKLKYIKTTNFNSINGLKRIFIYELENFTEKAWFVRNVIPEDKNLYLFLNSDAFDPNRIAVVKDLSEKKFSNAQVKNINRQIHKIEIEVDIKNESFLVLSEINYPDRWKAYVDGKEQKIYQVNGVLRGLLLKEGDKSIIFEYDNSYFKLFFNISKFLISALILSLFIPNLMALFKSKN